MASVWTSPSLPQKPPSECEDSADHHRSLEVLVTCGHRRHSCSAFDNVGFCWSMSDLVKSTESQEGHCASEGTTSSTPTATSNAEEVHVTCRSEPKMAYVRTVREPPDGEWGWVVVSCAAILTMLTAGLLSCYGILLSVLVGPLLLGPSENHLWIWLAAGSYALHSFSYPAWTFLSSRLSSRKVAALGSLFFCLIFILSYLNTSLFWISSAFVLAGLGTSACCASSVIAVEEYFSSRLHTALSLSLSGWATGLLLWPRVLNFSFQHGGAHWTLFAVGSLGTLSVLASSQLRPSAPYFRTHYLIQEDPSKEHDKQQDLGEDKRTVSVLCFYTFVVIRAIVNVARTFVMFVLPGHMASAAISVEGTAALFGFCGMAEIVGRLFGGWMQDHKFEPAFRCWLCAGLVLGGASTATAFCSRYWTLLACVSCLGLAWGLWAALSTATVNTFLRKPVQKGTPETALCLLQIPLCGVAPFAKDVSFYVEWISSSTLCVYGTTIVLSSFFAFLTSAVFNYKRTST